MALQVNSGTKSTLRGTAQNYPFGDPVREQSTLLTTNHQRDLVAVQGLTFDAAKQQEILETQGKTFF